MKKIVCLLFVFLMLPSFLLWAAGGKEEVDIKTGEKVVKGEIPLDAWQQLRTDLEINRIDNKKRNFLAGYG